CYHHMIKRLSLFTESLQSDFSCHFLFFMYSTYFPESILRGCKDIKKSELKVELLIFEACLKRNPASPLIWTRYWQIPWPSSLSFISAITKSHSFLKFYRETKSAFIFH